MASLHRYGQQNDNGILTPFRDATFSLEERIGREPQAQLPIANSQFPVPNSQFPVPSSTVPSI